VVHELHTDEIWIDVTAGDHKKSDDPLMKGKGTFHLFTGPK
jgi:hypothetical protein